MMIAKAAPVEQIKSLNTLSIPCDAADCGSAADGARRRRTFLGCVEVLMRDLFENAAPENPMAAARRGARPVLRKRFYNRAAAVGDGDAFALRLDDQPVRTPAGRLLAAPTLALALALAAEWEAQRDVIDPAKMPLTRLANSIIDGVADRPGPVAAEVGKYLASDLVCYRAASPRGLAERQARHWDPVLDWAREQLGARLSLGEGVIHVAQPEPALAAARAAIPNDPWRLGAVHSVTTLTGSALIALALLRARLTADEAWQAAHVDEDWNMEQWGRDELALDRRAYRFAELKAAATVLQNL
jgi:chaperone required for assembly of F1-ATPase